jgi:threonine synthase
VVTGTAPSGGLWVPERFPDLYTLRNIPDSYSFFSIGPAILARFFDEIGEAYFKTLFSRIYPNLFDTVEIIPLKPLDPAHKTYLLELFHGPTLAFKDIALTLLPYLMNISIEKNEIAEQIFVITATSGDTGKAALSAFSGVPKTRIFVIYPSEGVSPIQRKMMLEENAPNTRVFAVKGTFDDGQNIVKSLMSDKAFESHLLANRCILSTANSINLARILVQTVYYFSSYFELCARGIIKNGERVSYCVPTGNFGNILAGYYALRMGLPIKRLICASNANCILTDFFKTGEYNLKTHSPLKKTSSPSMDILISSNFERWLFEALDRDSKILSEAMSALKTESLFRIDTSTLTDFEVFWSGSCSENMTRATITEVFRSTGIVIDPHTAVANYVLNEYRDKTGDNSPCIVLATASPFKFPLTVVSAIVEGKEEETDENVLEKLSDLSGIDVPLPIRRLRTASLRKPFKGTSSEVREAIIRSFEKEQCPW